MSHFSEAENKGQYCRFVQAANGSYVLEPVKVPAHIIAERKERARRQEIRRHAENNRHRAESINGGSVLFLAVVLGLFVLVCCTFLGLQNQITVHSAAVASLQKQISSLEEENDTRENRLATAEDLSEIEVIASEKLGMKYVESDQISYYSPEESDYMMQYDDVQ
ncbi:MAG: hypothetical protein LUB60_02815 [Clostridiales bacterium]|nr:hypothetical protein [Clostridiales bacterium]